MRNNWWYILFTKPDHYLYTVTISTLYVGSLVLFLYTLSSFYLGDFHPIPPVFHTLLGFVLGLLLVFRTNTAYDRWWKATEIFQQIEKNVYIICVNLQKSKTDNRMFVIEMINLMDNIKTFLQTRETIRIKILSNFKNLSVIDNELELNMKESINNLVDNTTGLDRIKKSPIPISYSLHIKISILAYLITLPFGMLHDMGFWSIPLVMSVYYIIAGIEIISNEIENPFRGDPNDIPVEYLLNELKLELKKYEQSKN